MKKYSIVWLSALVMAVALAGRAAEDGHAHEAPGEKALDKDEHAGHAHGAVLADWKSHCEHEIPIYTCDECRYEAGVVKVKPGVLKQPGRDTGLVAVGTADRRKLRQELSATGEIRLNENAAVHVTPRIPGVIRKAHVDVGSRVKAGDVLFEIDSVELGDALGLYLKSRALSDLTRRNLDREQQLMDRKVSAEKDLIEARMAFEEHQADLDAARHRLIVLGLSSNDVDGLPVAAAGLRSGVLPFRAPIDGLILQRHASMGERVQPGDEVMLLADLSRVWAFMDLYEKDLAVALAGQAKGPQSVTLKTRAFPDREFPGTVDFIGATMDEQTRTVKARATVDNREGLLRPGMFFQARMAIGDGGETLAAPRAAVMSDEGKNFVFTPLEGDYFIRRDVKTGRTSEGWVEILDGLKAGEAVVTEGAFLLKSDVLREKMGAGCAD